MAASLYRHFDASGALLYVGISKSAIARLAQHANGSGWFSDIARVAIEHFETREDALIAEREAIHSERPLHNIQHNRKVDAAAVLGCSLIMESPTDRQIEAARRAAGHTQDEAIAVLHRARRMTWNDWECGRTVMPPELWELYLLKTGQHPTMLLCPR